MKSLSKYLPSVTLAEWGAIMLYFYASGRIAAFLHPTFRPMVLVTGVLLLVTAAMLFFSREANCAHADSEHEHEHDHEHDHGGSGHDDHEQEHHEHDEDEHSHDKLTSAGVLAFFVLLLPLALATLISPDSYGAGLVASRGTVENVQSLPGIAQKIGERMRSASAASPDQATGQSDQPEWAAPAQTTIAGRTAPAADTGGLDVEPPLPTHDAASAQAAPPTANQIAADNQQYVNEFLKPNKDGNIKAEVIDLVYAAQDASMRGDFNGKRVEMIGQFLPLTGDDAKQGKFKLVRMFMVCCAADAMPVSVVIAKKGPVEDFKSMGWVKVVGTVKFETIRGRLSPMVAASAVTPSPAPAEPYLN